jgi:hypothetical protein
MRLTPSQTSEIVKQHDMVPIPPTSPAVPSLNQHFGDHTFFIDEAGLKIWAWEGDDPGDHTAVLVQVAEWSGDDKKALRPHSPKRLDAVATLPPANE